MLLKEVKKYWNKLESENLDMCASFTLFRLLKNNNNFKFKNTNILDVGFGEGQNLVEFKKRGANIHGIELRKEKIKKITLSKIKKNNFYHCDLNISFPKLNKKFNLIFSLDTFQLFNKIKTT